MANKIAFLNDDFTPTTANTTARLQQCYPGIFPILNLDKPQLYFIEGPSKGIQIIEDTGLASDFYYWKDLNSAFLVAGNQRKDLSLSQILLPRGLYLFQGGVPLPPPPPLFIQNLLTGVGGLNMVNTSNAVGLSFTGQMVLAFRIPNSVGGNKVMLYAEYGAAPGAYTSLDRVRLSVWYQNGTFLCNNIIIGTFVVPFSGILNDWHELSISVTTVSGVSTISFRIDNNSPVNLIYNFNTIAPTLTRVTAGYEMDETNTTAPNLLELAYYRRFNSVLPYSTYHCQMLTGTEPGLLAFCPFNEGVGTAVNDVVNGTPHWTRTANTAWGSGYVCVL